MMPARSNNADVHRALRKSNQLVASKYRLKHARGHQDGSKNFYDLPLEAKLNMECDSLAKEEVIGTAHKKMGARQ